MMEGRTCRHLKMRWTKSHSGSCECVLDRLIFAGLFSISEDRQRVSTRPQRHHSIHSGMLHACLYVDVDATAIKLLFIMQRQQVR